MMNYHGIDIAEDKLAELCRKWKVAELSLFGSILRDDFGPDSDVDVLVVFHPDAPWSMWDLMDMKEELEVLFERSVDLVEKEALRNPWRKRRILSTYEVVYAA
ncbi:MAG: nucleotidyltransferase family protein [Planctomycetota bacterium]|jgi:predicted nucleotidyltransferase